jgi:membrane protein implicated in regulation of membrane protease activity
VPPSNKTRRRRLGTFCLLTAIVMLIGGETVLAGRLSGIGFIAYWLACFVLTALAAFAALLDAARVRAEQREEQRALLENTLQEIEREKKSRPDAPRGN